MAKAKCIDWSNVSELYLNQKLSTFEIAKLKGVCPQTVLDALKRVGIPRRQGAESFRRKRNPEKWSNLEDLYINQKMSVWQIAKLKHSIPRTVRKYLILKNIPVRSYEEAFELKAQLRGKSKGAYSNLGYTFVRNPTHPRAVGGYVREHILIWEQVHGKQLPKGWIIHHLNGIRSDNRPENLIALPNRKHIHILEAKAQRIRELEAKVRLLERVMDSQQLLWWSEN